MELGSRRQTPHLASESQSRLSVSYMCGEQTYSYETEMATHGGHPTMRMLLRTQSRPYAIQYVGKTVCEEQIYRHLRTPPRLPPASRLPRALDIQADKYHRQPARLCYHRALHEYPQLCVSSGVDFILTFPDRSYQFSHGLPDPD